MYVQNIAQETTAQAVAEEVERQVAQAVGRTSPQAASARALDEIYEIAQSEFATPSGNQQRQREAGTESGPSLAERQRQASIELSAGRSSVPPTDIVEEPSGDRAGLARPPPPPPRLSGQRYRRRRGTSPTPPPPPRPAGGGGVTSRPRRRVPQNIGDNSLQPVAPPVPDRIGTVQRLTALFSPQNRRATAGGGRNLQTETQQQAERRNYDFAGRRRRSNQGSETSPLLSTDPAADL